MRRSFRTLVVLLVGLMFSAGACLGLVVLLAGDELVDAARIAVLRFQLASRQDEIETPIGTDTTPLRFEVRPGDTAGVIGANLAAANLITDSELFRDYARVEGLDVAFEAGTYFFNQTQSLRDIALALTDSSSSQITLTVFPGWRIEQIATTIDTDPRFAFTGTDFLGVAGRGASIDSTLMARLGLPQGASLEGFMYPDTYSLPPNVTAPMLRDVLLETFLLRVGGALEASARSQGWTLYEVVTLASIVQREAIHNDEHALIAGVYRNRLDIGMRLDADPTVQYPLGEPGNWWPNITVSDYQGVISDYNTYRRTGLPPGPIANPGMSALQAVLTPEPSNYLFFRADCRGDGYHDFAVTYEEHLANGC